MRKNEGDQEKMTIFFFKSCLEVIFLLLLMINLNRCCED